MSNVKCLGQTAQDCFECRKYFSSHSSHYDAIYNKYIIEITCCIGGYKVFEDNDNNTGRRLN